MKKKTRSQKLKAADARLLRAAQVWQQWNCDHYDRRCACMTCELDRAIEARLKLDEKGKG